MIGQIPTLGDYNDAGGTVCISIKKMPISADSPITQNLATSTAQVDALIDSTTALFELPDRRGNLRFQSAPLEHCRPLGGG